MTTNAQQSPPSTSTPPRPPLRLFEAFAGYGSQAMAMARIGVPYEVVGIAEIDKYALQAYEAVHGNCPNYGDISKIDWSIVPDFDLFTYSSPCQDFSAAGKQRGGAEGSGTRSSLLWECRRAIEAKRPKYCLLENVKALTSTKFRPYLHKWMDELTRLGYTNFVQVLNAKHYGVPQNRERVFLVSILGDAWYTFPQPIRLTRRLRDVLEPEVDERYYISDKFLAGCLTHRLNSENKGRGFKFAPSRPDSVAKCISTLAGSRQTDNYISIKHDGSLSETDVFIAASRGRNPDNPSLQIGGIKSKQRLEINTSGTSNTITSVQKDNYVIGVDVHPLSKPREFQGYVNDEIAPCLLATDYKCPKTVLEANLPSRYANKDCPPEILQLNPSTESGGKQPYQQNRIFHKEGIEAPLDPTNIGNVYRNCSIRKLTPRECFRLMDVSDSDIDKIQAAGISNTQQYKLAGNSIVVACLEGIFRALLQPYNPHMI